jgi:hypothetical protein
MQINVPPHTDFRAACIDDQLYSHALQSDVKEKRKNESYPRNGPWRPIGLSDVKDPTLSRQSAHKMVVRLSTLRIHRTLLPRNIIIFKFLVLISVRG